MPARLHPILQHIACHCETQHLVWDGFRSLSTSSLVDMPQGIGNKAAACTHQIVVPSLMARKGVQIVGQTWILFDLGIPKHLVQINCNSYRYSKIHLDRKSIREKQILNPQSRWVPGTIQAFCQSDLIFMFGFCCAVDLIPGGVAQDTTFWPKEVAGWHRSYWLTLYQPLSLTHHSPKCVACRVIGLR